ncbi:PREDICTED: LOW QUALITY PROTEIN: E3 ubiquitin-protein ligase RNF213-like [Nanorana parkeri]|uniref:LOW QUALITY PROTEIN: E3 ubiquitin-protein ligase RNF213-like n=1 Tax=Nanorana parkeri TaxID=125878 RepID=UPI000853FEE9|nr:PREDICTED: LOW QUALITY PROTEIN: E3 ubiquitin-protein ligase RNF213-like [Nanorana parkeri]
MQKRNRKKSKKNTGSDSATSLISLITDQEDSSIVEVDENEDECESLAASVSANTQPTAQTIENADTTRPAESDEVRTESKDDEHSSKGNAVSISIKDGPLDKEKHGGEDGEPVISMSANLSASSKNEGPESMKTNSGNFEVKSVSGKEVPINEKITDTQVRKLKMDISHTSKANSEGGGMQISQEPTLQNERKTLDSAMDRTRESNLREKNYLENQHDSQNVKSKEDSKNISSSAKDTSDTRKPNKDTSSTTPDLDERNQISNKSATSAATPGVDPRTDPEKTSNKVSPGNKNKKKDTKLDDSTNVSVPEENNNSSEKANNDNKNTGNGKRSESEQTTKQQNTNDNEKETDESTKDSPSASSNTLIQKDENKKQEKGSKNQNMNQNKAKEKEVSQKKENTKKVTNASKQQSGDGNTSNKEKADNKEKQEAIRRELNPEDCITLYFHVIVSKHFNVKTNEDKVIVKGGGIEGYRPWKDVICMMNYTEDLKQHGYLYEGQTQVPKNCLNRQFPYKYVIVRANGEKEFEFIYNSDVNEKITVNRCLYIQSNHVQGKEWHQYDDVCMKENRGLIATLRSMVHMDKYKDIFNGKMMAGEVMLSRIFSILTDCDAINMSNFLIQLNQFCAVYGEPLLFGGDRVITWKSLGFGGFQYTQQEERKNIHRKQYSPTTVETAEKLFVSLGLMDVERENRIDGDFFSPDTKVNKLILNILRQICEPFLDRKKLQAKYIKNRLMAGLVCVLVVNHFNVAIERTDIADICSVLCLVEMPRDQMIDELHRAKATFCKIPGMDSQLRALCQKCIDDRINEWVWVLPVFHDFSAASNAGTFHKATEDKQEDIWAGLESLIYNEVKNRESDVLKKMVAKKYLLQVDPLLIKSWLCLIPINHMEEFLQKIPVRIVCVLRACYFKFPGADYSHREPFWIKDLILSIFLSYISFVKLITCVGHHVRVQLDSATAHGSAGGKINRKSGHSGGNVEHVPPDLCIHPSEATRTASASRGSQGDSISSGGSRLSLLSLVCRRGPPVPAFTHPDTYPQHLLLGGRVQEGEMLPAAACGVQERVHFERHPHTRTSSCLAAPSERTAEQQQTEDTSESNSQVPDLEKVLEEALFLTEKWLEDVYGHKFTFIPYGKRSFHSELWAWHLFLKAGENATQRWKNALVPVLLRKIKQEEAIDQISVYCKEQNEFKSLHPSINKCFEDCAIEAVHLACQSETNILSKLSSYNLENFGRLVSSVIENSWPKDNQGNYVKESDAILQHLLMWTDATYIFKLYGSDSRIISQFGEDSQELVALSESVFLKAIRDVMDGTVLYKHIQSILKHKKQFVAICKLKTEKKEKLLLSEINQVLKWRNSEFDKLQTEREWVNSLLKMIESVDKYIKVNVSEIHAKHLQELGSQKLMDMLPVKTLNSDDEFTGHDLSYYNLSAPSMTMAEHLNTFRTSHVFTTCWERQANAVAESSHSESSNESEDDTEYTVEEIVDELFNPCLENCKKIYNDLKSGQVTFEVVDEFLADFKDNYGNLEKELEILCGLGDRETKTWISNRVMQIKEYHQLDVAFRSAEAISEVKGFFNLDGDFQTLETLLQFADDFENYKQNSLSCISTEVMKTKQVLSKVNENHIACLKEVLKRKEFILWVKEALTDVNELKVFVDLASISAGENDMDVDRVACFHDAVLGYSPLFYDLKCEFGFDSFMLCLEKLWKALQSDPKLPEKLRDSARHIEWLKTVKESHGSVELSSLSLATAINKKGTYIIRAPKDKKVIPITPDNVLNLVLPENENNRWYTLEELKELLNKLMLMSSKGEQGNVEVDKFSEIFSNVQRLAGSFIDLYLAGNMLFRTWEAVIQCADNATVSVLMNFDVEGIDELQGEEALSDLLPSICKTMERLLEEWLAFVNKKRSKLYYLNYYTAEQLVYLCQQYQMREISEEALVMLSFIKPDCAKLDTITPFYFPKAGSPNLTVVNQPDMMDFSMDLEDCSDVSNKLELVWKFSMDNMNSFFPGCLDLDALGTSLAALAELNKKWIVRDLHPSLQPGRPNLILCPSSEILSCAIAVYMHSSGEPLPSYDEVLLCTPHTTFEEVALFLRRCLTCGYNGKKIYSLINADQLSYDVGYKSELLFQQLQAKCIEKYNLVIICNSDREGCYIPSVFSQFKIHVIPQMQPVEIQRYLCTHFKVGSKVVSAASVFKNGMTAGIVSSKRAGVGKSLYVKRLYQRLESKFSSKKPLLKIIRLIKPEVDENKVLETLLPFLNGKSKSCPIIFHIDITSSVKSGISEFLFKLLVLQYLMDSEGRIWKRLPSHLYIIEILESSDILFRKQFKSVPRIVQNGFIDFFPKIYCCSPKEVLTKTTQTDVIDCGDPGMDIEEFRSECFQRPYQYLIRFDQEQNLDMFVYIEGHTEGDPAKCLQIFLLYCGIVDPSWSELRNFAWFLNLQLRDCEASVFCNHEFVGDTLQGFKNFVVNFMILMAKDFATPSLHIADQSPGRYEINLDGVKEQDLVPFLLRKRWESEPHPYIFFNEDHASMTFIGFHLEPNNAGGVDAINPRNNSIIRQNVMSAQLYEGLKLQRVPFNTDFDQLPRHEKISRLCLVLGIQWPMDPDETYELTMDNIDDTSPHKKVGFIGISNWALDPAKMNRGIFVSRGDPNRRELIESAKGICSSDKLNLRKVSQYFSNFSEAYLKVCETLKEQEKEFFGLRDFYSLIKMVFAFTKQSQTNLTLDEIARAVLRNFSGKDEVNALEIFLGDESRNIEYSNTIDLVMENIRSDSDDCRYLLILTKNYAGLQILQQAFLKENQQPEIIFGSSFPKDQEYTQVCRNINRVKICMETGQMVILLNLQNLYESLYDALNQYYVYLAGQKYVDLGLGTHRVKCRVHPKFRLVVIEEKEVVYKDFPIPLINRLEKHYLDINTFLKKEHKVILQELEAWVEDFTKGKQTHTIGNAQTYRPSDVFIGYHSDTCASVVLQVTENMKQSHTDTQIIKDVKNKAELVLLNCATPDSVIRLGRKELIEEYFKKQKHGSLLDFLYYHVTTGFDDHTIFTEITTFSRLLTSADRKVLETELRSQVSSIEILSLQQFDTEFSFLKKIRSFLECSSGNLILIIQTDFEEGSQGANLVASAKYSAVNEIQKVNLKEASVFVYFITKLPRMQGGTSYVGFRGGLWQSIHIDDLRKSKDMVDDVTALQDLTISRLFYTEETKEPGKNDTKHKTNMETEMEVEMIHGNEDSEIHSRGDEEDKNEEMDIDMEDKMETENETSEDQEMETDDPLPRPEDMMDTTILIRSCVQNAIGLLRDDENVKSRSTRRIEILISVLSTEDQIKSSFLKMLKYRLYKLLETQEVIAFSPEQWVIREAGNHDALQEAGTFRQTLWKRVQTAVTPLLSQILSVVDRNANLDLLVAKHVEDYVKCLWMYIFQDENLLPIDSHSSQNETILVKNYMNIAVFGENCLPFSWRIKDYLEDIWTQAQHIDTTEGPAMKFLEIFCKTPLGKYVSSKEENTQHNLFLIYKRDFILMNMSISSAEELKIMEFALSACIEELRSSTKSKEPLQLPWVHIGYITFQHRLQNLNRILVVNPSVLDSLLEKITDPRPLLRNEMVLDIYAAIACLESLKHTMQRSDPQEWMRQVKNIHMPIELTCSEGYLQGQGAWCKTGINQIRKLWNCVFSMALFIEHLLVGENLQDENMQGLIIGHTLFLGHRLEHFTDIKTAKPFMAVVDALHKCRNEVANSVSRFGMQLCAVCQGDPNEPVCLECGHVYCQSCLKQWLDIRNRTCPLCKKELPENFTMVVSKEIRESMQKNIEFRKQCNGFFMDIVCNLCFKDNRPPDDEVIHHLISFLFDNKLFLFFPNIDSVSHTRSLSPFEDAVDKTPVIRSVILKLLLKYSFDNIMKHAQDYLDRVKRSNLLKIVDTKEVYLLFINCLEDSLYEKKQKVQNEDEKLEYFETEALFLQNYLRSCKRQKKEETSVQLLQDVARVRLALDVAAEMMSVKLRGSISEQYLRCVKDLCSQSGNDWYRVYLIRKLANLEGIDMVQRHFKDPAFRWLFPQEMLQKKNTETNHIDHFLVCGESYKVLREGISRAMMEGKEERIATAMEECKHRDQKLAVHLLLAVFREITLCYGVRNNGQQNTSPEQESVMDFIKNANIFKDRFLKQFLETLLTNSRPFLRALPGMSGSYVTIFGLAVHLASILLSGNNNLLAPLKNISFSSARMQNSYLPTMPEDMLTKARNVIREPLQWYCCPNGHYCAIGECGQPMQTGQCLDCGARVGGENHAALPGFQRIQQGEDRTQTGHVLGDPDRQGPAVAPDRDIAAPAFILLRMITHLAMLLGSEEDTQNLMCIVKPPVQNVQNFVFRHIERDLEYLRNSLGKSTDDTTTVIHLVLDKMLSPQRSGQWPVNFDEVWSTKEMRNNWEKHFVSMVITPVLGSLDRDLMTVNNYIRQDERISSNPVVKVVYGDPLISGEKMDLPKDSNVYCSKIWSCRERITIEYILHTVQQQDGKDTLPLLWKFLEKETELQMVKFLPDILKLQKDLVKKFQNYKDINYETVEDFLQSIKTDGANHIFKKRIQHFMLAWNHLRLSLQTKGEIKLPEGMCDEILTMDSKFEFFLPRRQGLGLGATALTSYLIALHNSFIYALAKYTNIEPNYSIKASEVMDLHVISYELEKDLVPIILSNCQYSLESGKETLQEFDFPKIQNQLTTRLLQGKPLITMVGLPTLTLSHDRNYEHLFTDLKKRLPQDGLSNSAIDVISKDLNAFSDVCEALNIVDISLGFLATSGGNPELSLTEYVEDVLQMKEQSSTHVLEALKRCHLKNTIALWQLLTALKSQHLLHLKRDPFASVDTAYKHKLDKERQHALNVFLEQNGTNRFLLELHEMIMLKLGKPRSADDFPPSWILREVLAPLLDDKGVSFLELENDFPEQIALAHCIEAWKVAANKKWNRI